jgi:hypothetical protein
VISLISHRGRYLLSYTLVTLDTGEELGAAISHSSYIYSMSVSRASRVSKPGSAKAKRVQVVV